MKFLDRKEQVLELQMTQYGKSLLSRGSFKPVYYAFFDDDVVYDSEYMSTGADIAATSTSLENSTTTSDRIKKAIRPEPQYNYAGVETNINRLQKEYTFTTLQDGDSSGNLSPEYWTVATADELPLEEILSLLTNAPNPIDNYYSLGLPMGTSEYNSSKAPAFNLNFHGGEIADTVTFFTGSGGLLKIPQLEVEAVYEAQIHAALTTDQDTTQNLDQETENVSITKFETDNSFIRLEKDHVLIDMTELNSLFQNENFDIEVYEIESGVGFIGSSVGVQENLRPLFFIKKDMQNDQLYDVGSVDLQNSTQSNVEYYFEVTVDEEIQDSTGAIKPVNTYDISPNNKELC